MLNIKKRPVKIMLDPGHGGRDPGVIDPATGQTEANANLDAALTMKYILAAERPDWEVHLTRHENVDLMPGFEWTAANIGKDRMKRMQMANDLGCDIFISVHYDIARAGYRYGVYHCDTKLSIGLAKALASGMTQTAGRFTAWVRSQQEVRFGALYVRFFAKPSTCLMELGPVRRVNRQQRMMMLAPIVKALIAYAEEK